LYGSFIGTLAYFLSQIFFMLYKSSFFLIFGLLFISQTATAQKRAGFYIGNNFSTMKVDPREPVDQISRLAVGGFGSRRIGAGISSIFGLQYIGKGGVFDDIDAKLSYLQLDLGFQAGGHSENGGLYLLGGIGLGGLLSARGRVSSANVSVKELFEEGELSYTTGLGLRIKTLFVEGLYASSITSVTKEEFSFEAFNRGFQIRAGFSFDLW
jgi:hypothetical protein